MEVGQKLTTKEIGDLGEQVACKHLKNKGFSIIERNYWRKWGELDIVASSRSGLFASVARETSNFDDKNVTHETKIHFIEVKTLSYGSKKELEWAVTHETWRPEEQVHRFKLHQIEKALETWISEHGYTGNWQIDVVAVRLVPDIKLARVKIIENITN